MRLHFRLPRGIAFHPIIKSVRCLIVNTYLEIFYTANLAVASLWAASKNRLLLLILMPG